MCRVLKVHRSGFYAWLHEPLSPRAKANEMLTAKIRESYDQSMGIYGSPRIFCDLREAGVACGENRVARLMRAAGIKSVAAMSVQGTKWASLRLLLQTNCNDNSSMMSLTRLG